MRWDNVVPPERPVAVKEDEARRCAEECRTLADWYERVAAFCARRRNIDAAQWWARRYREAEDTAALWDVIAAWERQ